MLRRVACSCLDSLSPCLPLAFLWPVVKSVGKLSIFVAEFSFVLGQFKVESLSWVSAHQVLSGVAKCPHICLWCSRIQSKGRSNSSPLPCSLPRPFALNFGRRAKAFGLNVCHYSPGLICKCRLDVNWRLSRQPNRDESGRRVGAEGDGNKSGLRETFSWLEWSTNWCELLHWLVATRTALPAWHPCLYSTLLSSLPSPLSLHIPSPHPSPPPLPVNLCTILSQLKGFSSCFTLFSFSSTYFLLTVEAWWQFIINPVMQRLPFWEPLLPPPSTSSFGVVRENFWLSYYLNLFKFFTKHTTEATSRKRRNIVATLRQVALT